MGQRSQIYVRMNKEDGTKFLIPRYYQWNYGTQMVSRAKGIIEYIKNNKFPEYLCLGEDKMKLERIMDINWDYRDVALGVDLIKEYADEVEWGLKNNPHKIQTFSDIVFTHQDNNDGQLLIDVVIDYSKRLQSKKYQFVSRYPFEIKYAFVFPGYYEHPLTPDEYLEQDLDIGDENWKESVYYKNELKYTERNSRYIQKNASLMTTEEVSEYINYKYNEAMGIMTDISKNISEEEELLPF